MTSKPLLLATLLLMIPLGSALTDYISPDGSGGFWTPCGHVSSDGSGGYWTKEGHVSSDGSGGYWTPDGGMFPRTGLAATGPRKVTSVQMVTEDIGPRAEDTSPQMGEAATGVPTTRRDAAADCPSLENESIPGDDTVPSFPFSSGV